MNRLITLCAIFCGAFSAPSGGYSGAYSGQYAQVPVVYQVSAPAQQLYVPQPQVQVVKEQARPIITGTLHHSQDTYGQYKYGYSSSDGQEKEEARDTEGSVDGKFSYISPEGHHIALSYEAGKDGFQASGEHLPEAPEALEVPEELAAAYKESNDRLAQAYEEARLRGDTEKEESGEGGSDGEEKEIPSAPSAPSYQVQVPAYQAPVYQVHLQAPAAPVYQVQAPAYQYVKKVVAEQAPSYQAYVPNVAAPVAYQQSGYYHAAAPAEAPKKEEKKYEEEQDEEKSKEPVPYLSSSYSTEIGGVHATIPVVAVPAKAPSAPTYTGY